MSLIFWPAFLFATGMTFSEPGSEKSIGSYLVLIFCVGYGVLPFVTPKLAVRALNSGHSKLAYAIAVLPSSIVPLLVVMNFVLLAL